MADSSSSKGVGSSSRGNSGPAGLNGGKWDGSYYVVKDELYRYIYGTDGRLICKAVKERPNAGLQPKTKMDKVPKPEEKPKPKSGDWPEPDPPPEDP